MFLNFFGCSLFTNFRTTMSLQFLITYPLPYMDVVQGSKISVPLTPDRSRPRVRTEVNRVVDSERLGCFSKGSSRPPSMPSVDPQWGLSGPLNLISSSHPTGRYRSPKSYLLVSTPLWRSEDLRLSHSQGYRCSGFSPWVKTSHLSRPIAHGGKKTEGPDPMD